MAIILGYLRDVARAAVQFSQLLWIGSKWPGDGSSGTSPQKPCDTSKRLFEEREKSVCCQQSPKSPKVLKREHVANLYNRYKEHMV